MSPKILDANSLLARESEMLDVALSIIKTAGVTGLTIDKLVAELPYSKGTVYNHFSCKEDIVLALCSRGKKVLIDMFGRAAAFEGTTREKALAIHFAYMLFAKLHPTQFLLVITAKSANVIEKASEQRRQEILELETLLLNTVVEVFKLAVDRGDCHPPPHMTMEQLAFSCWSIGFGTNALFMEGSCGSRAGLVLERELVNNVNLLHDGMQWRPFSSEYPWSKTIKAFKTHTFREEVSRLEARGQPLAI